MLVVSPSHFQQIQLLHGIFKRSSSWPNLAFTEVTECFRAQRIIENKLEGTQECHSLSLCHQAGPRLPTLLLMGIYVCDMYMAPLAVKIQLPPEVVYVTLEIFPSM